MQKLIQLLYAKLILKIMNRTKTVSEIKRKYSELIACLAPERSSYRNDVNKLVQDCKEELHARYDALIAEVKEAGKDLTFAYNLENETGIETYRMQNECTFESEDDYELSVILKNRE